MGPISRRTQWILTGMMVLATVVVAIVDGNARITLPLLLLPFFVYVLVVVGRVLIDPKR